MAYDPIKFATLLSEIETYLGYLRANENAWEYLEEVQKEVAGSLSPTGEGMITIPIYLDEGYQFPCPEGQYAVTPYANWSTVSQTAEGQSFDRDKFIKTVQENASQAWRNGESWAAGVADYAHSVCAQFTEPDVTVLAAEVRDMQAQVVRPLLLNQSVDNWAYLGSQYTHWTGEHAVEFQNWYDNYNDIEARYGRYLAEVNTGFAMATNLINGVQLGAQTFLEEIRDRLKTQLANWAAQDRKPVNAEPLFPPWVGDVASLVGDVLALGEYLPVVGSTVKGVNDALGSANKAGSQVSALIKDVEKVSGKDIMPTKAKKIPIETAEQIYTGLTNTLYDDYLKAYEDGMERMNTGNHKGLPDAGDLNGSTFSARDLVRLLGESDGGWETPISSGSMRDEDDDY